MHVDDEVRVYRGSEFQLQRHGGRRVVKFDDDRVRGELCEQFVTAPVFRVNREVRIVVAVPTEIPRQEFRRNAVLVVTVAVAEETVAKQPPVNHDQHEIASRFNLFGMGFETQFQSELTRGSHPLKRAILKVYNVPR